MKTHNHWWTRRRIAQLFVDGLRPTHHQALLRDIHGCARCMREYRRYELLEAALCGGSAEPTAFALERMEGLLLHAAHAEPPPSWFSNHVGALALASGLFAGAMAVVHHWKLDSAQSVASRMDPRADGFVARGEDASQGDVGIRAFRVIDGGRRVEEAKTLLPDDTITFSYTNVRSSIRYLAVLGMQAVASRGASEVVDADRLPPSSTGSAPQDSVVRWYYPNLEEPGSIPIKSDRIDEPLGDGFQLALHHRCGWLRVVAIFSPDPIATSDLREALVSLPQPVGSADPFPSLPFAPTVHVLTHSILLQIVCPP